MLYNTTVLLLLSQVHCVLLLPNWANLILISGKLGVSPEEVQHGVEALMFLFVESSRVKVSQGH